MATKKLFKYIGKVPTNVCWNGVSFPVAPRDIIRCYPEFIAQFIPAKLYKEVESGTPRHDLGRSPFFLRPDPTGGLPMRSDPNAGPRLKDKMPQPVSPALVEETIIDNPYDLGPDPKLEISTDPTDNLPQVKAEVVEDDEDGDDDGVDLELGDAPVETDPEPVEDAPVEEDESIGIPTRTDIRKKLVEELRTLAYEIRDAGCPLNPEKIEAFNEINEDTVKGVLFATIWEYYGYDNTDEE